MSHLNSFLNITLTLYSALSQREEVLIFGLKLLCKRMQLSRFLMDEEDFSGMEVDHIDRNPLNHRIKNLRVVDNATNNRNKPKQEFCSSNYRGVIWDSSRSKWMVRVIVNGKKVFAGRFKDEMEAAVRADDLLIDAGHDLWNLNFPIVYGA